MYNDKAEGSGGAGYTMDDLNDAIGENTDNKPKPAGSGMWGAVGKAATGDNT